MNTLKPCVLAAIYAFDNVGLDQIAPDARGKSVLALNQVSTTQVDLLIYGPIGDFFWSEGITAASIVEQLSQITAGTINVRINSDGGVVSDGLAIFNALNNHPATVDVTIDGVAASIASLIAQAGKTRRVYRNSTMMLHGPQSGQWGFAGDLRDAASMLDTIAESMLTSYTARATSPDEIEGYLTDRRDHWFTADQMVIAGLADEIIDVTPAEEAAPSDAAAAAALLSYVQAISSSPSVAIAAALHHRIQTTVTASAFASLAEVHQRAVVAHIEDPAMKQKCNLILATAGINPSAQAPNNPAPGTAAAPTAAPAAVPAVAAIPDPIAALAARNDSIRGVFAAFHDVPGVRELESTCLADPRMTVEQAQARLLQRLPNGATPLAAAPGVDVTVTRDEEDTRRARIVDGILARANVLTGAAATAARQDNPAARQSLITLAEASLIRAGVSTRDMTRDQIASRVLAVQTTSDFPILLESTIHRMVLAGYAPAQFTWPRFCATGTLSDYRPHNRYHLGSFSDLKGVNEAGEYENGVMSDATKETITGKRKGRILQITPEVVVNDDLGAFSRPAGALGQAAGRTIEKDVYAVLALNAGLGPVMSDGKTLFHDDHGNIPTSAALAVGSIDAARQKMATQKDYGGNDYLSIVPALWLGPLSLGGAARSINAQEYDDEATKHQRKPNVVRGIFRDVVDTPYLSGNPWYMFADPAIEPVIEVAFLDGVQTPTLEQEKNFRTDGLAWKVVHRYGVGAVGWKGAIRNAGG